MTTLQEILYAMNNMIEDIAIAIETGNVSMGHIGRQVETVGDLIYSLETNDETQTTKEESEN